MKMREYDIDDDGTTTQHYTIEHNTTLHKYHSSHHNNTSPPIHPLTHQSINPHRTAMKILDLTLRTRFRGTPTIL